MGNQEREPDMQLGDAELAVSWPVATLDTAARERLMDHAAEVGDFAAVQEAFDATAPRLDELARARLLGTARSTPKRHQSWPWQSALATAAATLLAVVATGQWQRQPTPTATVRALADAQAAATSGPDRAGVAPLPSGPLDEPAELAALLPLLDDLGYGEEFAAEEAGDDSDTDLGAGLDALHGVESEGTADFGAI